MNSDLPITDAIAAMVKVGAGGCGFEQHLGGLRRALTNPANGEFLRHDANLAIVILGDEDDCSARDPRLFDSGDGPLGPLASYRCTRAGLACNEDLESVGVKTGCHSNAQSPYVEDVGTYVDFVAGLKADRRQILTAAIVGDPSHVEVAELPPSGGTGPNELTLVHSCMYTTPPAGNGNPTGLAVADPGVRDAQLRPPSPLRGSLRRYCPHALRACPSASRLAISSRFGQFAASFGGVVESVCVVDMAPQLTRIGHAIKRLVGDSCLAGDTSGTCTVTDEYTDGVVVDVPPCPADGDCYAFAPDAKACPDTADHRRVTIRRLTPPPLGTYVAVRCATRP